MSHIDDPAPKSGCTPLRAGLEWRLTPAENLAARSTLTLDGHDGIAVLDRRRSVRELRPIEEVDVAFIVRETFKNMFVGTGEREGRRRKRSVSAGAIHAIKCVFVSGDGVITLYEDDNDCFARVSPLDPMAVSAFVDHCHAVLPNADGRWVVFVADPSDTERLYDNHLSLIWRDAGAALQTMALIATMAGLGFCPLGLLGQELVDTLLPKTHRAIAVGVAALGRLAF